MLAVACAGALLLAAAPPRPARPNVLLMLCDDLRPWMPFYGDEMGVQAPNLAKLAATGMAFNNTYCQAAVCSPTRNSFMTGRRPDSTRIWNFKGSFRTVRALPGRLSGLSVPQRFTMKIYFVWGFCMGAQGA